ncbi:hypothetical protein V8E36_007533, partial [Tilletia maclaganii]
STQLFVGLQGVKVVPTKDAAKSPLDAPSNSKLERLLEKMTHRAESVQIGSHPSLSVVREDCESLRVGNWLTSVVITVHAQHILHTVQSKARTVTALGSRQVLLATSALYMDRCTDANMKIRIETWYSDTLVTAVNFGNMHWATVVVWPAERRILLVDSMPSEMQSKAVKDFFQKFLVGRAKWEAAQGHPISQESQNPSEWNFEAPGLNDRIYPRQRDGHSCGIIVCRVMEAILRGKTPTWRTCGLTQQVIGQDEAASTRAQLFLVL